MCPEKFVETVFRLSPRAIDLKLPGHSPSTRRSAREKADKNRPKKKPVGQRWGFLLVQLLSPQVIHDHLMVSQWEKNGEADHETEICKSPSNSGWFIL